MPFVSINTWKLKNEESVRKLLAEVTYVIHQYCNAPLDKITVTLTEMEPSRWADGGVTGNDPDFLTKSRRQKID